MPRSRTVKGGFFRSPDIQHTPVDCRLLFISLWTQADREGRLEDLPWKIRDEAFPYDHDITEQHVDHLLDILDRRDLITRYVVDRQPLIVITKWSKHQHPHPKEAESVLPASPASSANARQSRVQFLGAGECASGNDPVLTQVRTDRARTSDTSMSSGTSGTSSTSGSSVPSGPSTLRAPHTSSPASKTVTREKKTSRGERLPEGWVLPLAWGQWAMRECTFSDAQVREIAAVFADFWHAASGRNATKLDWFATWRNWCRRARDEGRHRMNGHKETIHDRRQRTAEAFGVAPVKRDDNVYDLPPEDCHVVSAKR
ncbi:hypothetical protein [Paraburkholderia sp. 35.1]|uniref:hypothetical protein n=1 Tax=Paraburkholderia sp. 35.1 TaxID=2991058 RepID=UPI003D25F2C6